MENEKFEIQNEDVVEENSVEVTEDNTQNNEEQNNSADESTYNNEEYSMYNNDNSSSAVYSTELIIEETQYNNLVANLNLLNNLGIIQVMFLFLLFIYLFIHFCLERRKY